MRMVAYRLVVALLTFSTGIGITGLWAARPFHLHSDMSASKAIISEVNVAPEIPARWKKIDVKGQFSFYLPPHVEEMRPPNIPSVDKAFHGRVGTPEIDSLYLNYVYGKRASCGGEASFGDMELSQRSEVVIDGQTARVSVWQNNSEFRFSMAEYVMTLCFPDIGHDQKKLYLYASGYDLRSLATVRQIFNSIKFH